jgi:hypothetical protein
MAENHVLLETIQLAQSAASVVFDNIPQIGYTDLKIVISARTDNVGSNDGLSVRFNGNNTNYTFRQLYGDGSTFSTNGNGIAAAVGPNVPGAAATSNTFGNAEIYIPNYRNSSNKPYNIDAVGENNATTAIISAIAGLWSNTSAITSVTILSSSSANLVANTTFSLYGISEFGVTPTVAPKAAGGNIITNDGTYWYHAFTSSGYFIPQTELTCDYLVIAGGGGGGAHNAGGGGAGGFRSTVTQTGGNPAGVNLETALSLISGTAYTVSIGAGGAGGDNARGASGSNSVFSTITSVGGAGGGGNNSGQPPVTGGSGGGGSQGGSNSQGTSNQGFEGGGSPTVNNAGGGGGGAGAAGSPSSGINGGNGGAGVQISSFATPTNTGVSGFYAGGGGGSSYSGSQGAAGSGGATAGSYNSQLNATANTGSGAGARNREPGAAGSGGSGLVIIRYPIA